MAKRDKGFTPPSDASIPEDTCVLVFLPNDLHAIAAFWGQYEDLGLWTSWARTGDRRGRDIAERYKQSIRETMDLYEEIGCMSPLTINVNCGAQQCCPQTGQFPTINLDVNVHVPVTVITQIGALTGTAIDDGTTSPNPGQWPTYPEYQDYKCKFANEYARNLLQSWEEISRMGLAFASLSIAEIGALIWGSGATMFAGLIGAGIATAGTGTLVLAAILAVGGLAGPWVYRYFNDLLGEWSHEDMVCAIYGATTAEEAQTRIKALIDDWAVDAANVAQWQWLGFIAWISDFLSLILRLDILEAAFQPIDYIEQLPDAVCTSCAGVLPPPTFNGLLDNLIAYYPLEDSVGLERPDVHGDHYLAEYGLSFFTDPGKIGNAERFLDTDNCVLEAALSGHATLTFPNTEDWSLSFWCKPTYTSHTGVPIATQGAINANLGGFSFQFRPDFSMAWVLCNLGGQLRSLVWPEDFVGGAWYHIACGFFKGTFDGMWLQINGSTRYNLDVTHTTNPAYTFKTIANPLTIGGPYRATNQNVTNEDAEFAGLVDEVAVWMARHLSQEDVVALYNGGNGLPYASFTAGE